LQGSTATVFEAALWQGSVPTSLALKILKPGEHGDKSFMREVEALKLLRCEPGVVKLKAAWELARFTQAPLNAHEPVRVLALELCSRGDLFDVVAQFEHGLPEVVARIYMRQIWRAVASCHKLGVTHVSLL
jgi:serine/threonine protein kinase